MAEATRPHPLNRPCVTHVNARLVSHIEEYPDALGAEVVVTFVGGGKLSLRPGPDVAGVVKSVTGDPGGWWLTLGPDELPFAEEIREAERCGPRKSRATGAGGT